MHKDNLRRKIETILSHADIKINGDRPWDIKVHNEGFYKRVLAQSSLGFGESHMEGWWDCDDLVDMLDRIFRADVEKKVKNFGMLVAVLRAKIFNFQKKSKAFEIGKKHYDIGNDLYKAMLDKRMVYTCGYWRDANNLDEAQENKLDLICRKIGLKQGDRVLDIGCGWGSFAQFAAEKYGASVLGITVSKEQVELGNQRCQGLPVELRLQDYRDVDEKFDHIVSLGMFEHVGVKNYRAYMEVVRRNLKDNGLFLLHTIGGLKSVSDTNPWTEKYIFPNSMLPSAKQITTAIEGKFVMEDWHNFAVNYEKTLLAWDANFEAAWDQLKNQYDQVFYRMWKFYLLASAASFRSRKNQLWQIVLSPNGVDGGYESVR